MAKRDARQETASKGKTKAETHTAATQAHKAARVARQAKLASRPDTHVSENCLKNRMKRRRQRHWRSLSVKERKNFTGSPSELGERQFGSSAKGWHIHQRDNGLARALTPMEFKAVEKQFKAVEKQRSEKVKVEVV